MQHDTPDAIYNRPAALFVAGFTGAPPMNLVDATVDNGRACVGGAVLDLPPALAARAGGVGKLKLGVRPENLHFAEPAEPGGAQRVPAEVVLIEPLGAETLVTLRIGTVEFIARGPAAFRQAPGTALPVWLQPQHLHLFDADSGAAIRD